MPHDPLPPDDVPEPPFRPGRFDPRPPKGPRSPRLKRWAWIGAGGVALLAALTVGTGWWLWTTTPSDVDVAKVRVGQPSQILFADGSLLDRYGSELYQPVKLNQVPQPVIDALIATEDARFRSHHGVDPVRLFGAVWGTLHGNLQGGSTITQQLARNLFPEEIGNRKSLLRKAREMAMAVKIEQHYSKDQILEMYLNSVPFLFNVVGIEMAARTYFGTTTRELDTLQAATLIGMLKGSVQYNPVRHPERARDRRNLVMAQMVRRGSLAEADWKRLSAAPLGLNFARLDQTATAAPHFAAQIRRQLQDWADQHDLDLASDGLIIQTTLDPKLQAMAEAAVDAQADMLQNVAGSEWAARSSKASQTGQLPKGEVPFGYFWQQNKDFLAASLRGTEAFRQARQSGLTDAAALAKVQADPALVAKVQQQKTRLEAAFVAMDPRDGRVLAWVGSRDYAQDSFDHVSQARRQPGSTFKPFVYGAALLKGISPDKEYVDAPVEVTLPDGQVWRPTDMGGSSGLPMTLREGLAMSKNTITTQVMQDTGLPAIVDFARTVGIRQAKLDPVPSLALGTSPVSLLEMAGAYATLADMGVRHDPLLIRSIRDRNGRLLAEFGSEGEKVAEPDLIARLVDIMRGVITHGTGAGLKSRFGIQGDIAGKTGTTQRNTDGWFMTLQPQLVTGAWVGFNDQHVTIRSSYWGQGGHSALLIVGDFMKRAQAAKLVDTQARFPDPPAPPPPPPGDGIDGQEPSESVPDQPGSARPIPPADGEVDGRSPKGFDMTLAPVETATPRPVQQPVQGERRVAPVETATTSPVR